MLCADSALKRSESTANLCTVASFASHSIDSREHSARDSHSAFDSQRTLRSIELSANRRHFRSDARIYSLCCLAAQLRARDGPRRRCERGQRLGIETAEMVALRGHPFDFCALRVHFDLRERELFSRRRGRCFAILKLRGECGVILGVR